MSDPRVAPLVALWTSQLQLLVPCDATEAALTQLITAGPELTVNVAVAGVATPGMYWKTIGPPETASAPTFSVTPTLGVPCALVEAKVTLPV